MSNPRDDLLKDFARDLCTKTVPEIRSSWKGKHIDALEKIHPGAFEGRLKDHNPIYYMAQQIWFANDPDLLYTPLHRDQICKELLEYLIQESKGTLDLSGLLILVQRDSFKSTFMHGVVPLWFAIRQKYVFGKDTRILLTHQREEQAALNLQRMKAKCLHSPYMKRIWMDKKWQFTAEEEFGTKTKFDWPCKIQGIFHEPSMMAAGSGARLVGLHFDLMCNDDLVDDEQILSKIVRDRAKHRYTASRFMLDTKSGKEINSGTPYHIHDLWNGLKHAKDADGGKLYRSLVVGAGGKHTGEPLSFPTRHTQDFLDKRLREIKEQHGTDILYWLQMQCEPRATGLIATEMAWIKYISTDELIKKTNSISTVLLVDPAWKGTKNSGTGCDAAIAVMGFERKDFIIIVYLIDLVVSNEMTALDGTNAIFELMQKYGTTDVGVEEHNTWAFRTALENEAASRGKFLNLMDFKTKFTEKNDRIATFLEIPQSGRFFIVKECQNQEVFLSQFQDFPQVDKNDALDVVAYSADPNIGDRFAPRWNTEAQGMAWPLEPTQRTRHSMATY